MTLTPGDAQGLVDATASRLRGLQVDLSDKSGEFRSDCIREVVEEAIAQVVPSQRRAFLEGLMGRFPAWGSQTAPAAAEKPPAQEVQPADARVLAARLAQLASGLSEADRKAVLAKLREAGLVAAGTGGLDVEELRSALRVGAEEELRPDRLVTLARLLLAFQSSIARVAWGTWKEMAPKSPLAAHADFRQTAIKFLSGDEAVSQQEAERNLDQLLRLVTSLVSSIGQLGRQFASQHLATFAPDEIETIVRMEGGSFLTAREIKCWRKYAELAREALTQQALERAIRDTLVEYAESLIKGLGR